MEFEISIFMIQIVFLSQSLIIYIPNSKLFLHNQRHAYFLHVMMRTRRHQRFYAIGQNK
jgi:hypothetical protein